MTQPPISHVPRELFEQHIFPYLETHDILQLGATSNDLNRLILDIVFSSNFGKKTASEKDISSFELFRRTVEHLGGAVEPLPAEATATTEGSQTTGDPGYVRRIYSILSNLILVPESPKTPEVKTLKSSPSMTFYAQVKAILEQQKVVAQELLQMDPETPFPLQDLRDRIIRLRTVFSEQKALLDKLSSEEQASLIDLELPIKAERFSDQPAGLKDMHVLLGETVLNFRKETIPLQIVASIGKSGVIILELLDLNQRPLGKVELQRTWWDALKRNEVAEDFNTTLSGKLSKPRIRVSHLLDQLGVEEESGDRPILRLLAQMVVEIFIREEAHKLIIKDYGHLGHLLIPRGFSCPYKESEPYLTEVGRLRSEGMKYPFDDPDRKGEELHLERAEFTYPSGKKTQYSTLNELKQKALMSFLSDFGQEEELKTWEEVIAERPLLKGKGRILPCFYLHDLSKYERLEQKSRKPKPPRREYI